METQFVPVTAFPRGTLCRLLREAYAFEPAYERNDLTHWQAFDDFFYGNPAIADRYGLITTLSGEAIGFVSWDPRNLPDFAIVGHNCITPAFRGRGYGSAQMAEAVRRMTEQGAHQIIVTTNQSLLAAQRMYESVGFTLCGRRDAPREKSYVQGLLDYEYRPTVGTST